MKNTQTSLASIVSWAVAQNARDIQFPVNLLSNRCKISFFIDGKYVRPERFDLPMPDVTNMLAAAWKKSQGTDISLDKTIFNTELTRSAIRNGQIGEVPMLWTQMPFADGDGIMVTTKIQTDPAHGLSVQLNHLGFADSHLASIRRARDAQRGVNIFAGPVGHGKTLTVDCLLRTPPDGAHLVAAVDTHESNKNGVLHLNEIRHANQRDEVCEAVADGYAVYTTVIARSALSVIERLKSPMIEFPAKTLAKPGFLQVLSYQTLLPKLCHICCLSPNDYAHRHELMGEKLQEHQTFFSRLHRLYGVDPQRYRMRNLQGCLHCRRQDLNELNGIVGQTIAAEVIQLDDQMRTYIRAGDRDKLHDYWRAFASPNILDMDMNGKTAMEHAVQKAACGWIDPRDIEHQFISFEMLEAKQKTKLH